MQGYRNSLEHLFDELRRLDLMLHVQVMRRRHDPAYVNFNEFRGLFISEEEIDLIAGRKKDELESNTVQDESEMRMILSAIEQLEEKIARKSLAAQGQGVCLSLVNLAQLFHLTPFDTGILLVCIAPELDQKYERLFAYLQNDVTRKRPSVGLIMNLFCTSLEEKLEARKRLIAESPLLKYQLIMNAGDVASGQMTSLSRILKIDDRILNYLLDIECMDEQLIPFTAAVTPRASLDELLFPAEFKERLVHVMQPSGVSPARKEKECGRVFFFHGPEGVGKKLTAEALCKSLGISMLVADVPHMLTNSSTGNGQPSLTFLVQKVFREAGIRSSAVFLDHAEALLAEEEKFVAARHALLRALGEFSGITFVSSAQPWNDTSPFQAGPFFMIDFPTPNFSLRKQFWQTFLRRRDHKISPEVDLDELANKFIFTAGKIHASISEARQYALMRNTSGEEISANDFYQACRNQSGAKLKTLARKIIPLYTWDDIILPNDQLQQLKEICAHVRYQQQVFGNWGFHQKMSLGKGLGILFVGPSGTGKTMAVEIMANELGLDLYKIDLSSMVSKYIGETEKNLSRVFHEAEQSNAILFFDEADAIFGKRSEVKDSHDRYSNIEINYLLQRMEEYEGIVILASNFQKNIDEAFIRRMRFIVDFSLPDEIYRYRIWKEAFPKDTPVSDDIDFEFLAKKFKITGGNIRNIVLGAAFMGAGDSGVVTMEYIIHALRREFQKMGRLCVKSDFEKYYELVKDEEVLS
jgi:SpoVK/Ycf46/Vps4 family AAA+-type ATPase